MDSPTNPAAVRAARVERIALLIGFGIGSLAWNLCWPFLPLRVQAVSAAEIGEIGRLTGFLAGGANLITALLGAVWSSLGERFGYQRQILRAHSGTSISMMLIGLARTPLELTGAAGLLGALGGNYPHYMALAAMRTPARDIGRVVGDLQAAGQIGGTIGPVIGGLIASRLGLTASFLASGVVSLAGVALIATLVRPDAADHAPAARVRGSLRAALRDPGQRRLMLLLLATDAAIQGLRPLIPLMIAVRLTDPAAVATMTGVATTLATGGTVVAALVVGRLTRRVAPKRILLLTLPAGIIFVLLVPFAADLPGLLVVWTAIGLAGGCTTPAIFAWLGRIATPGGGGFALLASTNMLGFALGPMVMGQASVNGLDVPFQLAAALTLLGLVLVALSNPRSASA